MKGDNEPREDDLDATDDEDVSRLLRRAGRRPEVPEKAVAELWEVSRGVWQGEVQALEPRGFRRRAPMWGGLAAAAILLLFLGLPRWWAPDVPTTPVATLTFLAGTVNVESPAGALTPRLGDEIPPATSVQTSAGPRDHAALRLAQGSQIRMDVGTRLRFLSESQVQLEEGAVYVESLGAKIEIHSEWGVARNLGTRFEVRIQADVSGGAALRFRIREGAVVIEQKQATHQATAGEELTLQEDGSFDRDRVALHDPAWRWIRGSAPPFAIEGQTLRAFLEWIVAENGWALEWATDAKDEDLLDKTLYGSIEGLEPEDALQVVLPGYGLRHGLVDGRLRLELEPTR